MAHLQFETTPPSYQCPCKVGRKSVKTTQVRGNEALTDERMGGRKDRHSKFQNFRRV